MFRARDTRLGREVALKFISPEHRDDPDRRARLLQEARAASVLRSPSIATTFDIAEDGRDLFIVMELVEGEPLSGRLARGPLDASTVVRMAGQIADALDEAHTRGIIHRDIKSANLIIGPRGRVKILDFGLAKTTGPNAEVDSQPTLAETQAGAVLGTVSYMSPEQALGKTVDHRSDLFSLGVVMYEALSSQLPFLGDTFGAVLDQVIRHEPPSLTRISHGVPIRLVDMIRKLLDKAPDERYQSARELMVDLKRLRKDLEVESQISPVDGSSAATAAAGAPTAKNVLAVLPFSNITREPGDDWIGSGIAETVTADLKTVRGLTVLGRERVFDALRDLGSTDTGRVDERVSIDVGRQLRARWLVSGGYQRLGEAIRITARVVDVQSGSVLRTVKIDGQIGDIFALQDKIVYELSQGIDLTLNDSEVAAIERKETESVEAYEARSRAIMNILEGTPQALDRAIHLLEKATTLDPGYAAAWAALGAAYDFKGSFLGIRDLSMKAVDTLRRSVALNPKLTDGHRWLGMALMSVGRSDEAVASIEHAARLEPGDANVFSALGRVHWVGRGDLESGIRNLERAAAINPDLGYAHLQLGLLYAVRGEYDRAEAACRRAIEMQERFVSGREGLQIVGAYTRLGYVHYLRGDYEAAVDVFTQQITELATSGHALKERSLIDVDYKLGATYFRMGRADDAQEHFDRALRAFESRLAQGADDPFTKYYMAALSALRRDDDRSFRYLGEAIEALPALSRTRARLDPDFDALRGDARFVALLEDRVVS